MQCLIKISQNTLQQVIRQLLLNPRQIAYCNAGISQFRDRIEWLVRAIQWQPIENHNTDSSATKNDASVTAQVLIIADFELLVLLREQRYNLATAIIVVGTGNRTGQVYAISRLGNSIYPIDTIKIIGSRLLQIDLHTSTIEQPVVNQAITQFIVNPLNPIIEREIWSRTIGALGEETWKRIRQLSPTIIGAGRAGEIVTEALARFGVGNIVSIDHDLLSLGNIGEMVSANISQLGQAKVKILSESIKSRFDIGVKTFAESILSLSVLPTVKQTDFLFSCVDSPTARLAITLIAKLYLIPMIDVGVGIFRDELEPNTDNTQIGPRRMSADIRLIEPDRCLFCSGGIANFDQGRSELLSNNLSTKTNRLNNWRNTRAGSLRSLNLVASGMLLRMLEDYLEGRINGSTWLALDYDQVGIPQIHSQDLPIQTNCPICQRLTAMGDAGLQEIIPLLNQM